MIRISLTEEFRAVCPRFVGAAVCAEVTNSPTPPDLWNEIDREIKCLQSSYTPETLKQRSGIAATRQAYRLFGKDPSRYRPACEQLARRVLQGKGLYSVDTLVDLGNLVSLRSGYAIGALDADKVAGAALQLGVGLADEPYEGIGRGALNIEHMPVYRDAEGGVATPTSDHVRTRISAATTRLLVLINGYDGDRDAVATAARFTQELLVRHAGSDGGSYHLFA